MVASGLQRGFGALLIAAVLAVPAAAAEKARNVVLFIGDGMGVSTLTAARILEAQRRGADGASNRLAFERFPDLALVRTYSADALVIESAASASALLTGHRTRNGAIGVSDQARIGDCASALAARVPTLAELAKQRGLATGVVTNTSLTDATPASLYAHVPARAWQSDADLPAAAKAQGCVDIARQMVDGPVELQLDLMLGGGRAEFRSGPEGRRRDGRDLVAEWRAKGGAYVESAAALADLPKSQKVLGLFAQGHMPTELARQATDAQTPRLVDMTRAAITRLSAEDKGFFLMVEGGLIDKSHHQNLAYAALDETVELAEAVAAAVEMTDPAETLIVVTADHSHGLTINGGRRGSPILGLAPGLGDDPAQALDGKAAPILIYSTGPGAPPNGPRPDPAGDDPLDPQRRALAALPLGSAAHTGEDVAAYAQGPGSSAFRGLIDQPAVFQAMKAALGL